MPSRLGEIERIRGLITGPEVDYIMVCLGITDEVLLETIKGPGTHAEFDQAKEFWTFKGYLTDGRTCLTNGRVRDGIFEVAYVDAF